MRVDENPEFDVEVRLEFLLPCRAKGIPHTREVERQHEIAIRVRGRGFPDVEAAEEAVEVPLLRDVVVAAQRLAEKRLPEPARTHEEEEVRAFLHPADERGLVDVVAVLQADALEVLDAIGYLLRSHGE